MATTSTARSSFDMAASSEFEKVCRFEFKPNERGNPPGKLADVDLVFTAAPFAGMVLVGFAVWADAGGQNWTVTMPARQYSVSGEHRSFALLRGATGREQTEPLKRAIITAYEAYERDLRAARR